MQKEDLVRSLKNQGFSKKIIRAFERVERRDFIPEKYKAEGYKDIPLPIGKGQTISQPYTIAFMLSMLELGNNQKILEIGSGSGYVLALIDEISENSTIFGIERIKELVERSQEALKAKNNIEIIQGDGSKGLPEEAKERLFDRILISASSDKLPQNLLSQLKIGGVLVAPVRGSIIKIKKFANENKVSEFPGFVFVPLVEED
jgi:protein-L-isoaspartate(D-aspartate) O-methyltransferase